MWTAVISAAGQLVGSLIGNNANQHPTYQNPESDNTGLYVTVAAAVIFLIIIILILKKK